MSRLLTLLVFLSLFCGFLTADELQQSPVAIAFESLAYNPTDEQIEEFYAVLKEDCRLVPPSNEISEKCFQSLLREFSGIKDVTWHLNPNPELLKDKFARRCDAVAALRKYYAYCLCLIRLAMEGEDSDQNNPVSMLVRSQIALMLESFYKNQGTTATMSDGRKEHREWLSKRADELNAAYGYREYVYDEIKRIQNELSFTGKDKWEKLEDWKRKYDAGMLGNMKTNAFLDWLFTNFALDDIAAKDIPASIPIVGETFVSLLNKYVKPTFLSPSDAEWKADFKQIEKGTSSFNARLMLATTLLSQNIMTGEIRQAKCAPFLYASCSNCGVGVMWSFRTPAIQKIYDPVLQKSQECFYRQNYNIASGQWRLKKIDEDDGGPAWFMGYTPLEGDVGTKQIEDDFIYPTVYYITKAITGFDTLSAFGRNPAFYKYVMDLIGAYKWHPYSHYENEDPSPLISVKVDSELKYDITESGMIQMVQGEMGKTYFKGTNLVFNAYRSIIRDKLLKPGVFHYFMKTKWELYSLWDHDCMLDFDYFERPICVLLVRPDDEQYADSIVGLYCSDFKSAVMYSGAYYMTQRMWTAELFEKDELNSELFDIANKRTLSLDDYKNSDRWKKAMEEKKKYEDSIKDDIYW